MMGWAPLRPEHASPRLHLGVVEVSILGLAEDACTISLSRGGATDVLHLHHDEIGTDRSVEIPAAAGTDADAARAALTVAAREGHIDPIRVLAGGVLSTQECRSIIERGAAEHRSARDAAHAEGRRAALAAERARPSRILAAARRAGLVPEPVGEHQWRATCPRTAHTLMLGTGSETFGCGYCRVQGTTEDLLALVAARRT